MFDSWLVLTITSVANGIAAKFQSKLILSREASISTCVVAKKTLPF